MMINHHPDPNILAEYVAGSLDRGIAISVKAHLSMCPQCQRQVNELNLIGANYFSDSAKHSDKSASTASSNSEKESFEKLMSRIKATEAEAKEDKVERPEPRHDSTSTGLLGQLPPIVQRLIKHERKLKWQMMSPSLKQARLTTGQRKYEVCLHKIQKGGKVAEHDHKGNEITVILDGSFSDENGTYQKGDFLHLKPGDVHRPTATQDQDCLCLSVVEAPVKLTGFTGKLINPFLSFRPA